MNPCWLFLITFLPFIWRDWGEASRPAVLGSSFLPRLTCLCRLGWHLLLSSPQTLLFIPMTFQRWSRVACPWCPPAASAHLNVYQRAHGLVAVRSAEVFTYPTPLDHGKAFLPTLLYPSLQGQRWCEKNTQKWSFSCFLCVCLHFSFKGFAHVMAS